MGFSLLPHAHSGRLAHHRHTSYGGLFVLLVVAIMIVALISRDALADDTPPPVTASNSVSATVPAKVPTVPPTISSPGSGQEFGTLPITVSGSCQPNYVLKVFSNDVVSGAVLCPSNGSYSLPISLFYGSNSIIAKSYNALDEGGISSAAVGATYAPPGGPASVLTQKFTDTAPSVNSLFIKADVLYRGGAAGTSLSWPIQLVGGTAPYAVSVSWGDGGTDVYSRTAAGRFDISHTYKDAKVSSVVIKATDAAGHTAYSQLVSLPAATATPAKAAVASKLKLAFVWPLLAGAVMLVAGFFIGEWREKRLFGPHEVVV